MKENFEIKKELKFSSNIAEITSISLEEKHEVKEGKLEGFFIVSGEYKIHEISLNKEKFNFKIPYDYVINNNLNKDSLEICITDFSYDFDSDNLYVTINYEVTGTKEDILLFDAQEDLDNFLKNREVELIMDETEEKIDEVLDSKEEKEIIEPVAEIVAQEESKENQELREKEIEEFLNEIQEGNTVDQVVERNINESKEQLLNNVKVDDDNYIVYKVHIVSSADTEESILAKYKITHDELKEYNDYTNLKLGDKLIVPLINEE